MPRGTLPQIAAFDGSARVASESFTDKSWRELFQQLLQVLQKEEQVKWIGRAWFEIELLVPPPHVMVFCVYDQGANTRNLGLRLNRARPCASLRVSGMIEALTGRRGWGGKGFSCEHNLTC